MKNIINRKIHFTPREKDIMSLLLLGLTNKEIANRLIITTHTVRVILEHIFDKTSCRNRVQLVVYILKNNLSEALEAKIFKQNKM